MLNSSLLNRRMYNDSPQYLLLLDKSDVVSIAEDIHRILKCYVELEDSLLITEDISNLIPILYSLKFDNLSITDVEEKIIPILYKLIVENISLSEYKDFRMYRIKYRFRNLTDELDHVEIIDDLKFKTVT